MVINSILQRCNYLTRIRLEIPIEYDYFGNYDGETHS
jgi:hypothetical protein